MKFGDPLATKCKINCEDDMYVIVQKDGKKTKVVSGVLDTKDGAEALLKLYRAQPQQNGVTYYIKESQAKR